MQEEVKQGDSLIPTVKFSDYVQSPSQRLGTEGEQFNDQSSPQDDSESQGLTRGMIGKPSNARSDEPSSLLFGGEHTQEDTTQVAKVVPKKRLDSQRHVDSVSEAEEEVEAEDDATNKIIEDEGDANKGNMTD